MSVESLRKTGEVLKRLARMSTGGSIFEVLAQALWYRMVLAY
jgi:hypothetical protein